MATGTEAGNIGVGKPFYLLTILHFEPSFVGYKIVFRGMSFTGSLPSGLVVFGEDRAPDQAAWGYAGWPPTRPCLLCAWSGT